MDALNSYTRKVHIKMTTPQPMKEYYHYHRPTPKKAGWISFTITTNYPVNPIEAQCVYQGLWAPGAVIPPCSITKIHGESTDHGCAGVDALFVIQGSMARPSTHGPLPSAPDGGYPYAKFTVHKYIRHCTNCYKMDHTRRACPRSYCYKCREDGHWPPACPKKQNKSNKHHPGEVDGPMETCRSRESSKAKGKSNRSQQSQATAEPPAQSDIFIRATWSQPRRSNPKSAASVSSVSGRKHEV